MLPQGTVAKMMAAVTPRTSGNAALLMRELTEEYIATLVKAMLPTLPKPNTRVTVNHVTRAAAHIGGYTAVFVPTRILKRKGKGKGKKAKDAAAAAAADTTEQSPQLSPVAVAAAATDDAPPVATAPA